MRAALPRVAAAIALAASLTANGWSGSATPSYASSATPTMAIHALTLDRPDQVAIRTGPTSMRILASSANTGTNDRYVFWRPATPRAVDQQVCATWSSSHGANVQEGLSLRVAHDPDGRWREVTVMKNILYGAVWQFNVLTWDNDADRTMTPQGAVSLPDVFWPNHQVAPLPWKVCARVVGDLVTLKAWKATEAEPAWGDTSHGGTVRLPPGWTYPGKTGWYVGHIPPGGSSLMTGLSATNLSPPA